MAGKTLSRIVNGRVMHRRRHPVENRFVYPVFCLLINTDEIGPARQLALRGQSQAPAGFPFRRLRKRGRSARLGEGAAAMNLGIEDCSGPIWVQTFPRVFGYVFNPVSFWYCERQDGSIGAILAEVNNTFGDKHVYVLTPDPETGRFQDIRADKQLYVSPFYPVSGGYRFHFNTDLDAPRVRIDYFNEGRLQLNTAIWGKSRQLTSRSLFAALARQPLLTLGVMARIHWQALRLWLKGVSLQPNPSSSAEEATR